MKVLSTEGLTKLIDLIKSSFISNTDTETVTEIDTETVNTVTLAAVATTGAYSDLSGTPTVDQTYDGTSANAQSGVAVASAISGKANTDLSNISGTSTKSIDGQWVISNLTLANSVAVSSSNVTYSLASYLPNDGYDYEVLLSCFCQTDATSGHFSRITLRSDLIDNSLNVAQIRTRTSSTVDASGNCIIPVGVGRTIIFVGSTSGNFGGNYTLEARAYRRIGTNS